MASWGADGRAPFYDLDGYHRVTPAPNWFVWGRTPEGVRFRLETASIDEEPPRLLLTSGEHGRTTLAGVLNPDAALPIRVRLPEGGFVVAAVGAKLRYRLGGGAWLPLAGESALLPAGAAQVEVTKPGRPPEIVSLRP